MLHVVSLELIISRFKTDFGQKQLCYPTLVCVSRSAFVWGVNNAGILYKTSNGMSLISSADCSQLALLDKGEGEGRGGGQLPGFASRWQDCRTVFRTLDYITTTQKRNSTILLFLENIVKTKVHGTQPNKRSDFLQNYKSSLFAAL